MLRYSRILRCFLGAGMLLFFIMLGVGFFIDIINPPFMLSAEFAHQRVVQIGVVCIAGYIGLSFLLAFLLTNKFSFQSQEKRFTRIINKESLAQGFSVIFVLFFSYYLVLNTGAHILHLYAEKEPVKIQVVATSLHYRVRHAWLQPQYTATMTFDTPHIGYAVQSVYLTEEDRKQCLSGKRFPVRVTLCGQKSIYGYELRCCKQQ